jgi:RNA-binding protein
MNAKQRAYLKSLAVKERAIFNIGKQGVTPEAVESIRAAIDKRELIKIGVLSACLENANEIADILKERTRSEIVGIIGRKIILYKRAKKPVIEFPKRE